MRSISLVTPDESMEIAALEFVQEFLEHDETTVDGCCKLETGRYSYRKWLSMLRQCACPVTDQTAASDSETYFALSEGGKLIGVATISPEITKEKQNSGSICLSVRPAERGKGYGKEILRQTIQIAQERGLKKATIDHKKNNLAAEKAIRQNGGIHEKTFKRGETEFEQYRIEL